MNNKTGAIISALMEECYFTGRISAMTGATKEEIEQVAEKKDEQWEGINRASYYSNPCDKWFID